MAKPFDFGEIHLEAGAGKSTSGATPGEDTPFRIALMGDFSGRASRKLLEPGAALARRRAVPIDRDNFDEVLGKMRPELALPFSGEAAALRFEELDDFHPDRIFERAGMFRRLRDVRAKLSNPATFAAAAAELGLGQPAAPAARPSETGRPSSAGSPAIPSMVSGSLLDEMIEQTEARGPAAGASRAPDEFQQFLRRVTEPHLAPAADPRQAKALELIDVAASAQMRALLHYPPFQTLEAAWRAIYFLIRRAETGSQLQIFLLDISKEELAADLSATSDLAATGLYRLLVESTVGTPGAEPWALLAGDYTFGPEPEDAQLLGRLAKLASAAGAPFVAAASPRVVGCASLASAPHPRDWHLELQPEEQAAWTALRALPEASSIGLALPRFLLRLPYGAKTDSVESFAFEEMTPESGHEDYLWGNPAFAVALLLAQAFSEAGWDMRPGSHAEIDRLPLHVYEQEGESVLKPCAEALLTEDAAEQILDHGLMPLVSLKGQDVARLVRFQSIARPPRVLAGRWANQA
jgi:type VI secretion system protein ImpC